MNSQGFEFSENSDFEEEFLLDFCQSTRAMCFSVMLSGTELLFVRI